MAKKMKRQTSKGSQAFAASASPASSAGAGRSYEREFKPDYSLVIRDLKRIGILAGSFLVVLVVLSFII